MTRRLAKLWPDFWVALSLSAFLVILLAPDMEFVHPDGNICASFTFTLDSHHFLFSKDVQFQYLRSFPEWPNRFGGLWLAGRVWDWCWPWIQSHSSGPKNLVPMDAYFVPGAFLVMAGYYAAWFFLNCLLLAWFRPDAPLLMPAVFAGIACETVFTSSGQFLPWDISAMFFWTWACLLFLRGRPGDWLWLGPVIFLGFIFKETCLVPSLLLLRAPWGLPRRLAALGFLWLLCWTARAALIHFCPLGQFGWHGTALWRGTDPTARASQGFMLAHNWWCLAHPFRFDDFFFLGCGSMLLLWFSPLPWEIKALCGIMAGALALMGDFCNARQFFEILPAGVIGLAELVKKRWREQMNPGAA